MRRVVLITLFRVEKYSNGIIKDTARTYIRLYVHSYMHTNAHTNLPSFEVKL
jgi:hypothetical protein